MLLFLFSVKIVGFVVSMSIFFPVAVESIFIGSITGGPKNPVALFCLLPLQ